MPARETLHHLDELEENRWGSGRMRNVVVTTGQCGRFAAFAPFGAQRRRYFDAAGLQNGKMPGMTRRTAMRVRTATIFVMVKIQRNGRLNRRKTHHQQQCDETAYAWPEL